MKNLEILLLNDCFTHLEAKEVIIALIDKKINFYKAKNLRYQVRYEEPDPVIQIKLAQLEDARQELLELIGDAKRNHTELRVEAAVCIGSYPSEMKIATG